MPEYEPSGFAAQHEAMLQVIALYMHFSAEQTDRPQLDERVKSALSRVPRHKYVPLELQHVAYEDMPLPIGCGKTISQPFMVALMTDLLEIEPDDRVLEVGTGLGYQSAVLAELAEQVYTVELIAELAEEARSRLTEAGYHNIESRVGDGNYGWPEYAPFDKIIVTAGIDHLPQPLLKQLAVGGTMVIPVGPPGAQSLLKITKVKSASGKIRIVRHDIYAADPSRAGGRRKKKVSFVAFTKYSKPGSGKTVSRWGRRKTN